MKKDYILHIGDYIPADGNGTNPGKVKAVYGTMIVMDEEIYAEDDETCTVIGHKETTMSAGYLAHTLGVRHVWYNDELLY